MELGFRAGRVGPGAGLRVWLLCVGVMGFGGCQAVPVAVPIAEPVPFQGVGYLVINAPITPTSRDFFIGSVDKLRAGGAREIDLGINSPGGVIQSAQEIAEYMVRVHRDAGITFKAFNVGVVASAATYVFLNAQDRYSSARGTFLFHAAGAVSSGMVTSQALRDTADSLDAYERKIRATLVSRTHLTEAEAQVYVRRTVLLNADDAKRDGVIDAIAEMRLPAGARSYIISVRTPTAAAGRTAPTPEQLR